MSKRKAAPPGCFWRGDTLWGRIQVRGRDIKWSLRTNDPAAARRRQQEYREQAVARAYYGEQRHTFAEVLEAWEKVITRQVAPLTAARYAVSLGQLQPFLDGLYLDQVDGTRVAEIIRLRQAHKVTNATIKRDLVALLSSVLNYALAQGWLEGNPVLPRMRLLKERRDPIMLPEHSHIQMVIDRAPGMFANLVEIACKTGARQEELVNARREQLDHMRRTLSLIGKGNKRRTIDLDPFGGYEALQVLPAALGGAFLFWHHQGQRYRNVASRFRALVADVAQRASKQGKEFRPFRFHDLRHRHAVDWLQSGRSIYDLQQRLGHTSVKTTEMYLEFLTAEEARIVKQQAGTITGPPA